MKQFTVSIPEEKYSVLEFVQEDKPGVALINSALRYFEPKEAFGWHLSLMIDLEDLIENGMPSAIEREIIDPFGEKLDKLIKGSNIQKPNALFLARITWNATRELIWRVYDAKIANQELQQIIQKKETPRPLDFRMDIDKNWKLAEWHLKEH